MGAPAATPLPFPAAVNRRLDALDPRWILAAAYAVCTGLILWFAGDRIFAIDEWDYVVNRREWTLENIVRPTNAHLLAVPLVVYKGLLSVFGADSHLPFTILSIVLHLGTVTMVYVLLSRPLGRWVALLPALLVLFLGAGWEVMVNTAAMQNQFGIIAGLGMLLCLERGDRRGDVAAGILLAISLASFTIGLAFAAAATVRLLADRVTAGATLRRLAIVAIPVALYAGWYLWARQFDQVSLSAYSISSLPSGIFDQLSAIGAGVTGLFRQTVAPEAGDSTVTVDGRTAVLALVLLVLLVLRLRVPPRPGPAAWSWLALLVAYLLLIAIGLDEARFPNASRYVYMGTVLLVVAAGGLLAGVRITRPWLLATIALLALSLLANVAAIRSGGRFLEDESALNEAELAALELSRATVDPNYVLEADFPEAVNPYKDLTFPARDYFAMTDELGSPALTEPELAAAGEGPRDIADEVFAGIGGIAVGEGPARGSGEPPAVSEQLGAEVETRGACLDVRAAEPGAPFGVVAELRPGGFLYASPSPPESVELRRYGSAGVPLDAAAAAGTVAIPMDASPRPWQAVLALRSPTRICSLGEGA